jgi:prepilin-type processing-associated H-X9-DG protein
MLNEKDSRWHTPGKCHGNVSNVLFVGGHDVCNGVNLRDWSGFIGIASRGGPCVAVSDRDDSG